MKKKNKLKTVFRKLGRENACGQIFIEDRLIEIDPRLDAKEMLRTYAHEKWHDLFPNKKEKKVDKESKELADYLWDQGYRKVILK